MKRRLAIVDAYSTGRRLAPAFHRRGWSTVHVQSSVDPLDFFEKSFVPADFAANIVHSGGLDRLGAELGKRRVQAVVPGCESGVVVADALNESLDLPWNRSDTSLLRRDKYRMIEAIRRSGLRAPIQMLASSGAEVRRWQGDPPSLDAPLVVKPLNSGGTDGVTFCTSLDAAARAVDELATRTNRFGFRNDQVLVQEFLEGTEWVVNSVSWAGRHKVTDLWRLAKKWVAGAGYVYDYSELRSGAGQIEQTLVQYMHGVLDVLGIGYGAAHAELMMTADGPVLIEVGARFPGTLDPDAMNRALGTNQIDELVEVVTDPDRFSLGDELRLREHVLKVHLISSRRGVVRALPIVHELKRLRTFHSHYVSLTVGDSIVPTVDLFTSPGPVYLVGSMEDVFRDYQVLRELEERGGIQLAA